METKDLPEIFRGSTDVYNKRDSVLGKLNKILKKQEQVGY